MEVDRFEDQDGFSHVERHEFAAADARLYYVQTGVGGPPIVFIHGLTDGHAAYLPMMLALQESHRCYAVDLRGHGKSSRCGSNYAVSDYGADVQEFLERVVGESAILVGCSLGALVACFVASKACKLVSGLVLEDPPIKVGQMPQLRDSLFYPWFIAMLDILEEHNRSDEAFPEFLEKVRHPQLEPPLQEVLAWNLHDLHPATMVAAVEGTMFGLFDPDRDLADIRCPVMLLAAHEDGVSPTISDEDLRRMARQIGNFESEIWMDTMHAIHYQRPEKLVETIRAFVRKHRLTVSDEVVDWSSR